MQYCTLSRFVVATLLAILHLSAGSCPCTNCEKQASVGVGQGLVLEYTCDADKTVSIELNVYSPDSSTFSVCTSANKADAVMNQDSQG
jgi:hypothetical protein